MMEVDTDPRIERYIDEIIHAFDCENMPLDEEDIETLHDIAYGCVTVDERVEELVRRYKRDDVVV